MKLKDLKFFYGLILSLTMFMACTTDEVVEDPDPVDDITNRIVFWSDFDGPPIEVKIEGRVSGTITAISSSPPSCGSSGNVTKTLSPGSYSFSARETSSPNRTWSGTFQIKSNVACHTFRLYSSSARE